MKKSLYDHCIETDQLALLDQWAAKLNGELTPENVTAFSNKKVWWQCPNGHEYVATVAHRTYSGSTCPYCAGRKVFVGFNDLATVLPEVAAQWHPTKNGELTPEMVTPGSNKKVWWRCEHNHEWQAQIIALSRERNSYCPYCAGRKLVTGENDLQSQFPHIAAQLHPTKNGDLNPSLVLKGSNKKVWWQCELGHEYEALISDRTGRVYNCPYCSGRRVITGFNDLATKDPNLAKQWHPELNGELTPERVTPGSNKKVWWQCEYGHVWHAAICSRACGQKSGCPVCCRQSRRKTVETP